MGVACQVSEEALERIGVKPEKIDAILITHEHADHIKGVEAFANKYNIEVYAHTLAWKALSPKLSRAKVKRSISFELEDFFIKDVTVSPFKLSHDSIFCIGYSFYCAGCKISMATDLGAISADALDKLKNSDIVLLESNHCVNMLKSGNYPQRLKYRILSSKGHLSNDSASKICVELALSGVKQIILGHLSEENNTPALAYKTTIERLAENGFKANKDIFVEVALQDEISPMFEIS
jgi:phosphoribosyl 1,2-cyclic phosphodiesterase